MIELVRAGYTAAFLAALPFAAAAAEATIPSRFHGVWMRAQAKDNVCRKEEWKGIGQTFDNDRLAMVSARGILFVETGCDAKAVRVARVSDGINRTREGSTTLTLSCSGEGLTSTEREIWDVQTIDGRDLLIATNLGTTAVATFVRCR